MKTKILRYSSGSTNKVVTHYAELEKVCDNVYTYLFKKDPCREDDDLIAIVLNVDGVYFQEGAYYRRFLQGEDIARQASMYLKCFHDMVAAIVREGNGISLMFIRIYEELGRDTAPLIKCREEGMERIRQQDEKQARQREQKRKIVEAQRLQNEKAKFFVGEFISTEDFIALCRQKRIAIPRRTHGTLNRSVTALSHQTGIRFRERVDQRDPQFDSCYKLIHALKQAYDEEK